MDRFDLAKCDANDGLWDWNLTTNRIRFSPRWISMLGCEQQEIGNTPEEWFRRIHPEDREEVQRGIDLQLSGSPDQFQSQYRMLHKDGSYRWMSCRGLVIRDENGQAVRMTGSHSDITAERVADSLTGLPNRILFLERLSHSIERVKRHNDFLFAVLLLDLDRFQSLVDRLGSASGDQLLVAVARRLERCLRSGDTLARLGRDHLLARLGGDEFIILLNGLAEVGDAKIVAERLLKAISAPFEAGGREVFASASIGIALSVTGYGCAEDVLRDADTAMYRAKSLGRARCEVFDTAVLESDQTRARLEADLRGALERQEFLLHYQPIVDLASRRIRGLEALARWNHPLRGVVPPQEFIPVAESTGLIVPLGRWILREACRQLRDWQQSLSISQEVSVSVNLSAAQFIQPELVEQVGEALQEFNLEPHCLVVELTESVIMENPEAVISLLMRLRVLGVRIALDDFGTGYSSLSYLRQFPVDLLKIDRSFVRGAAASADSVEIIRAINWLAHQLGLRVVAEGIENEEQLDLMRSLGCEDGQGFFFSRAVDSDHAARLLKAEVAQSEERGARAQGDGESVALAAACSGDFYTAVCAGPQPDAPPRWKESRLKRRAVSVSLALAGLMLLLVVGIVVRPDRIPQIPYPSPQADLAADAVPSSAAAAPTRQSETAAGQSDPQVGFQDGTPASTPAVHETAELTQPGGVSADSGARTSPAAGPGKT
ncbi:MAG: EAL domain-containing protein, partial [Acidobacteria bacterium]|nr:EAL domain-containing protein [Acidobacteriota bacterium]